MDLSQFFQRLKGASCGATFSICLEPTLAQEVLDSKQQLALAQARFDDGCHLWSQNMFEDALIDIEKSREIQLAQRSWCCPEMETQLYYATGTIYLGLENYSKALAGFRQAWRISSLTLGMNHVLTKSSQHRIGNVLSKQGCGLMEIHPKLSILRQAMLHEKQGDELCTTGTHEFDVIIFKYRQSILEYQRHQDEAQVVDTVLEQAEIHSKIVLALHRQNTRGFAGREWATALAMYQSTLGSQHPTTMKMMSTLIRKHTLIRSNDAEAETE